MKKKVKATGHNVIVQPERAQARVGSVWIPDEARDRDQGKVIYGELISISPIAFRDLGDWPRGARRPEIGDMVYIRRYSAFNISDDPEQPLWVIEDKDILAIELDDVAESEAA